MPFSRTAFRVVPSQKNFLPTVIEFLMDEKIFRLKVLIKCTIGMAISASGSTFLMHFKRFDNPIPGSISIGIAPILKRAKARVINSGLGFTISSARWPFSIPSLWSPEAYRLLSSLS